VVEVNDSLSDDMHVVQHDQPQNAEITSALRRGPAVAAARSRNTPRRTPRNRRSRSQFEGDAELSLNDDDDSSECVEDDGNAQVLNCNKKNCVILV
jgi:hypothetical protein